MLRLAFLEADVNYRVVKEFEARVKARSLNQEVMMSLTPAQHFIKIVRDELTEILGQEAKLLTFAGRRRRFSCWSGCREAARPPLLASWPGMSRDSDGTRSWFHLT